MNYERLDNLSENEIIDLYENIIEYDNTHEISGSNNQYFDAYVECANGRRGRWAKTGYGWTYCNTWTYYNVGICTSQSTTGYFWNDRDCVFEICGKNITGYSCLNNCIDNN